MADQLVTWAVEFDAAGSKAALQAVLDEFKAELEALDQAAKGTKVDLDTTALETARKTIDDARKAIEAPIEATVKAPAEDLFKRLLAPDAETAEAPRPATVQSGLASAPIREAREELLATQKTAEGVGAAIRLVNQDLREMGVPAEFSDAIKEVQRDFIAGRATAEEALSAIRSAHQEATAMVMSADRNAADAFKRAESEKQRAAEETRRTIEAQAQTQQLAIARTGQGMQALTATTGSSVAMMLSLEESIRRARGESALQLHALHQLQEAVPHAMSAISGIAAIATGGPAGLLMGIPALITGIVGMVVASSRPPPLPAAQKEGTDDAFARVMTGALRSDPQVEILNKVEAHLRAIREDRGRMPFASIAAVG